MTFLKEEYFRNKFQQKSIHVSNIINVRKKIALIKKNFYKAQDNKECIMIY